MTYYCDQHKPREERTERGTMRFVQMKEEEKLYKCPECGFVIEKEGKHD